MLKLNHLTGFGSGAGAAAGGDVTSYVFDGTGDYLSIPDHADWAFEGSDWAIEAFIKLPSIPLSAANAIVANRSGSGARWQFSLDVDAGLRLYINDNTNTLDISQGDMSGWEQGVWYHVIASCSGNDFEVFRDGVSLASTTDATITFPDTSNLLTIGVYNQASPGSPFDGYIDEVRISVGTDRGFTGGSPTVPTSQYSSDSNTKLLIHGGEAIASGTTGSGATFVDSGNTGHTVTENGNAQRETEQEFKFADDGVGYFFDGTGDYLSIPDHADWNLTGDFTIECWIYVSDIDNDTDAALWSQYINGSNRRVFNYQSNGVFNYIVKESASVVANVTTGAGVISERTWHHIALVRSTNDYYIWIDGVDQASAGTPDSDNPVGLAVDANIGRINTGTLLFAGYIDEYRISDTARYTTGFTPSSTQFTSDANTLLLIHGGEAKSGTTGSGATFTDSGNTGHTVTENGNAIESTGNFYKF